MIGRMIALDNQPFSIVEDDGFKRLINYLEPRYEIPNRTYFSRTFIPDLYEKEFQLLQKKVTISFYSLTKYHKKSLSILY